MTTGRAPVAQLWPHQVEAVSAASGVIARGGRTTLVAACGTGKTRMGQTIAADLGPSRRVAVIVPTIELLVQTLEAYRSDSEAATVIAVCSEPGVAEIAELAGVPGVIVTTDAQILAQAATGRRQVTVLSTYASLPVFAAAHALHGLAPWDLIVVDEAHRTTGKADGPWKIVHHDAQIPAARRLYMTATPRIATDSGDATVSMDDRSVYGPVCYRLPFSRAIEMGLLADYRVVVPVVTDLEMHRIAHDASVTLRLAGAAIAPSLLAGQIAVLRCMTEFGVRRAITYHHRIAGARHWAQALPATAQLMPNRPQVWAAHVSGHQAPALRRRIIGRLGEAGDSIVVVSNAKVLNEGIDVPAVDAIVFDQARDSAIDTVQAVGRALRTGGRSDKIATIVVPLLLSAGESPEAALQSSEWEPVWQVIRALRDHDDRLEEQLRVMRQRLGETGRLDSGRKQRVLPPWLAVRGIDIPDTFAAAIMIKAVRSTTASWDEYFGAARSYAHVHGHANLPVDWVSPGGLRVGSWVAMQRKAFKAGRLDPARHSALAGLNLIWDIPESLWATGLGHATAYFTEHGHLHVRQDHHTADGYQLGRWISWQRGAFKAGRLTADQIAALEAIAMNWDTALTAWQRGYTEAAAYQQAHGDLWVSPSWSCADGFPLGTWILRQRHQYRHGKLTPEQVTALDAIGMSWDPLRDGWHAAFRHAVAYREQHGHLDVPAGWTTADGYALGTWIINQRKAFRERVLPAERVTPLEDLDICWDVADSRWNRGYTEAVSYHDHNKDLRVHAGHVTASGYRLGSWIAEQRTARTAGKLSEQQVSTLDTIGMSWTPLEETWQQAHDELRKYRTAEGNLDLPPDYIGHSGINLYRWMEIQRKARTTGRMPQHRIDALDEIGFPWDPARERWMNRYQHTLAAIGDPAQPRYLPPGSPERTWLDNQLIAYRNKRLDPEREQLIDALGKQPEHADLLWQNTFEELAAFHSEHQHFRIPARYTTADGASLARWATQQRQRRKQGKLARERIGQLDKIGFPWEPRAGRSA